MTIDACVHREDELGEVDEKAGRLGSKEAAPALRHVSAQAIQRYRQARNVKDVPNEHPLAVETEDGGALSLHRYVRVIAHPNVEIRDGLVRDERRLVGDHMISRPRVSHRKTTPHRTTCRGLRNIGDDLGQTWME
jgi:hypothetical protein